MGIFGSGFGKAFDKSFVPAYQMAYQAAVDKDKEKRTDKKAKRKAKKVRKAAADTQSAKIDSLIRQVRDAGGDPRRLFQTKEQLEEMDEIPWSTPTGGISVKDLKRDATDIELATAVDWGKPLVDGLKARREKNKVLFNKQDEVNAKTYTDPFGLIDWNGMPPDVRSVYNDPERKSNLELYSRDLTAELNQKQKQDIAYNFEPVAELFRQIGYKDGNEYDFDNMSDREMQYWTSPSGLKQVTDTNEYIAKYAARFGGPPKFDALNMEPKRLVLKEIKDAQSVLKDNKNLDGTPLSEERREAIQRGVITAQKRLAKLNSETSYDIEKIKKWVEDFDTNATDEKAAKLYIAKANYTAARPDRQKFLKLINPRDFETTVVDKSTGDTLFDKVYFEDAVGPDGNPYKVLKDVWRPWLGTFKESIPALVHGGMPLRDSKFISTERSVLYMPNPLIIPPSGGTSVTGGVGRKVPANRLIGKAFEDYYVERPEMVTKLQQLERQKVYAQYGFDLEGDPTPERMIPKTPDPKTPTGMETPTGFTQEELASKAAESEQTLAAVKEADEVTRDYMLNKEYEPSIVEIGDAAFRQDLEARELLRKAAEELTEEENSLLTEAVDMAEKLRILEIGLKRLRSK